MVTAFSILIIDNLTGHGDLQLRDFRWITGNQISTISSLVDIGISRAPTLPGPRDALEWTGYRIQ